MKRKTVRFTALVIIALSLTALIPQTAKASGWHICIYIVPGLPFPFIWFKP